MLLAGAGTLAVWQMRRPVLGDVALVSLPRGRRALPDNVWRNGLRAGPRDVSLLPGQSVRALAVVAVGSAATAPLAMILSTCVRSSAATVGTNRQDCRMFEAEGLLPTISQIAALRPRPFGDRCAQRVTGEPRHESFV